MRSWPFRLMRVCPSEVTFFSFEYSVKYMAHPKLGGGVALVVDPETPPIAIGLPGIAAAPVAALDSEDSRTPFLF